MSQLNQLSFSRNNVIFLCLCLGGLLLLVIIGILPLNAHHRKLDQEITEITQQLARQNQNQTDIATIDNILTKLDQQPTPQVVELAPLPQNKTSQITDDFRAFAKEVSLNVDRIDPLLDNKTDWSSLSVKAECYGELNTLRLFLLKLLSLPYVRKIDRLEIHPGTSTLRFTLIYTIDLA